VCLSVCLCSGTGPVGLQIHAENPSLWLSLASAVKGRVEANLQRDRPTGLLHVAQPIGARRA
jgi:hypothetical protein